MATVTAKNLFEAQYAAASDTLYYTSPASTRTIIDKFTATNTDGSACTLTAYIVPSGQSVGATYKILDAASIATLVCRDCTEMQNQILEAGDMIYVKAGTASKLVIRASGRQVA